MSMKKTIEIEAIAKDAIEQIQALNAKVEGLEDALSKAGNETKKTNKILGGLSSLMKTGLGIGVVTKLFDILKETFMANQKVADIFSTGMETLSLVFNQVVNAVVKGNGEFNALGTVLNNVLNIGLAPFKLAFEGISIAIMSAQKAFLQFTGGSKERIAELEIGIIEAKAAVVDIGTGVIDSGKAIVDNFGTAVSAIKEISFTAAYEQAQQNVQLQKTADLAIAQNRIVLEQKDREAEKLRQIRDDESKTIDERIEANNKLAAVLNEQERLMLANADAVIAAAQAQFDKNANDENQIALLEAKAEREGILAQIEGFRSEQLMNINSLNREKLDLLDEETQKELERKELLDGLAAEKELTDREKAEAELAQKKEDALKELSDLEGSEAEKLKIQEFFKQQKKDLDTKFDKEELARKEALERQKLALTANTLGNLAQLLGENSAAGKAAAIAQAVINSYLGFTEVLSSESILPQPLASIEKIASAGTILASGLQTVKQITSVKTPTFGKAISTGGGGGGRSVSAPQAPSFNVVGASPENQLAQALGQQDKQPIKAFVVSNEVTNAQALDRNIVNSASLG